MFRGIRPRSGSGEGVLARGGVRRGVLANDTGTVTCPRPVGEVFPYMADFSNTKDWDPNIADTTITSDGSPVRVGATLHVVQGSGLSKVELDFETTDLIDGRGSVLRAEAQNLISSDTITAGPAGTGSRVTYDVTIRLKGPAGWSTRSSRSSSSASASRPATAYNSNSPELPDRPLHRTRRDEEAGFNGLHPEAGEPLEVVDEDPTLRPLHVRVLPGVCAPQADSYLRAEALEYRASTRLVRSGYGQRRGWSRTALRVSTPVAAQEPHVSTPKAGDV